MTRATPRSRPLRPQRLLAFSAAFVATLVALPSAAVSIPDVPLQSGQSYPPANVLFILDDSGSMGWDFMPDGLNSAEIYRKNYAINTIYYNPAITYQPWIEKADGSRYAGGTSYTAAYSNSNYLSDEIDLSASTQTFYVPKNAGYSGTDLTQYWRYQIRTDNSGMLRVVRSQYETKAGEEGQPGVGCNAAKNNWHDCTFATPTGRSVADELKNFATWYSYYRTRIKVAKGGASEAFAQLGDNIRVGFNTIWNRQTYNIPVANSDGKFTGSNRSDWFNILQNKPYASGSTPLHPALQRAARYFQDASAGGPWGPESGMAQLSCRQNFAILTTDGYWNDQSGFDSAEVGDADGTDGPTHTSSSGSTYKYTPARPYADAIPVPGRANTLADVAMRYWKYDLRTDMDNNVPTSSADPAFWQHMVTFAVSIGLKGNLDPATDLTALSNGSKVWGNPLDKEDADRIDDLWHAAVNGRGRFVVASNPSEFARALSDALNAIAERTASASNVAANSTSFQSDTRVYQAKYVAGKWTGELEAYDATSAGVANTPAWRASTGIPTSGRKVFTWNGSSGRPFPTSSQQSALARSTGTAPVSGADNAAYIAGDRSKERKNGGTLRDRDTVLGDIVNSSPFYVADTKTIYVGANDGMLHAFDANDGRELFAYVPGGISLPNLATLSDPYYAHKYFVDGPVVVSSRRQTPNKNYLVGALGRGGKGIFALDVSNPASFGQADVMWELTGDGDMGEVLGTPLLVKLNNGDDAVILGNGINSGGGRSVLYVINLTSGGVIRKFDTGVGGDNGMSAPRGWDKDGNGTVDYVYAGDLKGNLWKFDLTAANASGWNVANGGAPLFVAKDASGYAQPITGGLALAKNPKTNEIWVFAGTGRFLSNADVTDTSVQSVYGLIDTGSPIPGRSALQKRSIEIVGSVGSVTARAFQEHANLASGKRGWYVDLDNPKAGERVVSDVRIRGQALVFASILPGNTACEAAGTGYINAIDAFSGTSVEGGFFDINNNGTFGDAGDKVGGRDTGSIGVDGMPTRPIFIDNLWAAGDSSGGDVNYGRHRGSDIRARRVSWRELFRD